MVRSGILALFAGTVVLLALLDPDGKQRSSLCSCSWSSASLRANIQQNLAIPAAAKSQAQVELAGGFPFISDAVLRAALDKAGIRSSASTAALEGYGDARIDGLKSALAILVLLCSELSAWPSGFHWPSLSRPRLSRARAGSSGSGSSATSQRPAPETPGERGARRRPS